MVVYYLPADPNVTLPGEIRDRWDNELISLFLMITIFPALVVSTCWRYLRARFRVATRRHDLAN